MCDVCRLAEWMAAEKERKKERAERKKRRLQKMLQEPKHKFEDTSYMESIKSTQEGMADSLKLGLQQDTSVATAGPASKRPKLWCVLNGSFKYGREGLFERFLENSVCQFISS